MNWIAELLDVYDKNQEKAGVMEADGTVLLPLYHTTAAAQITVTIDGDGNFLQADKVSKEDKTTLIPVTDSSASRTNTPAPHPLCDNLKYLAGDYSLYVDEKDCSKNHTMYMEQLKEWVESPYSHPKAEAVYRYLQQNRLMKDIYKSGIFELEEDGTFSANAKIQAVDQKEAFVRFKIETREMLPEDALEDEEGRMLPECWKDRSLQRRYVEYCSSKQGGQGLSYLTGRQEWVSYLQPSKIRHDGDMAKLISSNDKSGYTFRGRFCDNEEAFAIGYEDSQKVHNALKWIIRKQGTNYGSLYFVTWRSDLVELPDWQSNSQEQCEKAEAMVCAGEPEPGDSKDRSRQEEDNAEQDDVWEEEEEAYAGLGEADAARFRKAIRGYQRKLDDSSHTMIMAFDAATTGRLAMTEARAYETSRYLEGLQNWYRRCEWIQPVSGKDKGHRDYVGMVGIKEAAELLYGTEQKGYFSLAGKEERYKDVAKRWMPCILDNREVPVDMVRLAVQRASSPVSFDSRFLWERILGLACSLVKQQYEKRYGEVWTMALNESSKDRNYLYGRLLALADRIEYRTYDKGEERQTNARRYMSAFSQHPFRTWKMLEEKIGPYLMQLSVPERLKYQGMMDEICENFSEKDFASDEALSGLYLLGFHNQAYAFKKWKGEEEVLDHE